MQHGRRLTKLLLACTLGLSFYSGPGYSWGERGHRMIAVVGAKIIKTREPREADLIVPFFWKDQMLGQIANMPDIVWKSDTTQGEETRAANRPTHWIDLDLFNPKPTFANIPLTIAGALAVKSESELRNSVGTAPWRLEQLLRMMQENLAKINAASPENRQKVLIDAVNAALLYGGLAAHFIGDLTMPHHCTAEHDSYDVGQGGIHSYFEDQAVQALPLDLEFEVYQKAMHDRPLEKLIAKLTSPQQEQVRKSPAALAIMVAVDSFEKIPVLLAIDRKYARIKPSTKEPKKIAERKPVDKVAEKFRALIVERLALGADALAYLWQDAWVRAGKPDLKNYFSYEYPTAPAFVPLDYFNVSSK